MSVRPFELDPTRTKVEIKAEKPADLVPAAAAAPLPSPRGPWRRRLVVATGLGLVGALLVEAVHYTTGLIVTDPLLGWPMAALTAITVVAGLSYTAIEARDLFRLSKRSRLREEANRLAGSELHGQADRVLAAITAELPDRPEVKNAVAEFHRSAGDALADGERLILYERRVMAPVDRTAYRLVLEASRDIGILTALAPTGLLDGVLVLWRTTLMLRQVARLYGMAPGPATTFRLLRHSFRNAALAGLADIVAHAAVEHVGASLLAMLSARAGQGAGNALLASRLGLAGIRECRPLPFVAERPPRLAEIRKALLEAPADRPPTLEDR